ncbi:MAG: C25 family cysteine peptidase, partial [Dokdonella sp.]
RYSTSTPTRAPGTPAPSGVELLPVIEGAVNSPVLARAVAVDDWQSPAEGFDYLMVTHSTLRDAIMPLAAFHQGRGLKVAVIDVQDVYDSFNHGIVHPQAIRNLVTHASTRWPGPKPQFLLLVGDASFDIRNNTENDLRYAKFANNMHELAYSGHFAGIGGTSYAEGASKFAGRNLIPTWQFPSPEGQSASDNPFGIIGDGYHPTVAVGRFPVVEPSEVSAIVNKTIDYMTKPQPGSWRRDVMFITDESEHFKKSSDALAQSIGSEGFVAERVYASADESNNLAHQSAIKDGLNAGRLLVHFIGHGGRYIWRTGPPDIRKNHDLFTLDDVSNLTNSGRLPMVLSMTCYSAPFDNPSEDSIGERFLREPDKGAVAVFAASWRNAPSTEFSSSLVTELLRPGATIGEGIVRAKQSIEDRTLVEMYNLLGDPAVVLERPRDSALMALDGDVWSPGIAVELMNAGFQGQVDLDWLDEDGDSVARTSYQASESRFLLPIPTKLAKGKAVASVRLYSTDRISGRDASAGLDLRAAAVAAESRWRWPSWLTFQRERSFGPLTEDTIARGGFEADEEPVLVAGN